jgi:hypothetical protein
VGPKWKTHGSRAPDAGMHGTISWRNAKEQRPGLEEQVGIPASSSVGYLERNGARRYGSDGRRSRIDILLLRDSCWSAGHLETSKTAIVSSFRTTS